VNEFVSLRVGAYTENGRDSDFCPKNIKWRFPRYQGYNPLLFFTATCSNCCYTREMTSKFREWKTDSTFRTYRLKPIKERHLEELSAEDSVIKRLAAGIDTGRRPNESAIIKLLLAIYDESLAERPNSLELGRLYLRIGWVFRDMQSGEDPGLKVGREMIGQLEKRHVAAHDTVESLSTEIDSYISTVDALTESPQIASDIKADLLGQRDEYRDLLAQLHDNAANCQSRLARLKELLESYRLVLTGAGSETAGGFGKFPSFEAYLLDLRGSWDGTVSNETEALRQAIRYYRDAFADGRDISPGNQQIQASYLIAELSRRIRDHETAREYFSSTIKNGQQFIYQNRNDQSRTVLARKIMELAVEQGRANMEAVKGR
jgi:hypothetical protein